MAITFEPGELPFAITPKPISMLTTEIEASRGIPDNIDQETAEYIIQSVEQAIDARLVTTDTEGE